MSTTGSISKLTQSEALFIYYKVNSTLHGQTATKLKKMVLEFKPSFPRNFS
jgi:hypothetical protein